MFPVADMLPVAVKLLRRLEAHDAPAVISVRLGWDGARIIASLGDYDNKLSKSLPCESVRARRGDSEEEIATAIRVAVARLQLSLRGKTGKVKRSGKRSHPFRRAARSECVAREAFGD